MIGGRGRRSAVSSSGIPGQDMRQRESKQEMNIRQVCFKLRIIVVRGWLSELEIKNIFFSVSGNLF